MAYDPVGVLGRGGSAVVELAHDPHGRPVATKRVAVTGSAEDIRIARARLRREAAVLARLRHPGIVPVLDVIDDGADVVLVLPVMAENLSDRVRRLGPPPPAELAALGHTLIGALAAAHRRGVVHRDIKPANVLFDAGGRPALSDFGIASSSEVTAGLTASGTVVGSPAWMAPEQAQGWPATAASDIWSLAATLAYAAGGGTPGPDRGVDLGGVAAPLRPALARMLDPDPAARPSAAELLGGPDGTVVAPAAPAAVRRPARRRGPRRRRMVLAGAAGLALAVVAALGVLVANAPSPAPGGRRAAACVALPYQPCGAPPAPHTDGAACDPGWYDLDGSAADGCEARSDYVAGTVLTTGAAVRANLVPAAAADTFTTHVAGDALALCWGSLHVTLTAPAGTAEELTVRHGGAVVGRALSAGGVPATATASKPSCLSGDSEDLTLVVRSVAASGAATAADFTLTRDGGW